jgi:prepilin-type processing-associated H-X9-DG protein
LLVVIAVVALSVSLCLPAMVRATNQTKRAQCASNLRQFTLAMHIYANEYNDRLPANQGSWAWDTSSYIGTFVESTGSKWTVMYCPGTAPRFSDDQNLDLYNYGGSFRILGYANTFPANSGVAQSNLNPTLTPTPYQPSYGVFVTVPASQRVMLADATISDFNQNNPAARYTYNYVNIVGGYYLHHLSAHLQGQFPAGGNLGMLDGHVEWRKFDLMTPRSQNVTPVFWW